MIPFFTSLPLIVSIKSFIEKMMFLSLVLFALRNKENVAAKFGKGMYEIVATGTAKKELPRI